jgi:hypothetical protein
LPDTRLDFASHERRSQPMQCTRSARS